MPLKQNHSTVSPGSYATGIALGSFIIGTLLLFSFLLSRNNTLIFIGAYYVLIAFVVNCIVLLHLGILSVKHPEHKKTLVVRILIVLSNIPFALLYFFILFQLNF